MLKINKDELRDLILNGISTEELNEYDYSDITDMSAMFRNCTSLTSVPLFNTANVKNMRYMFYNCTSLQSITLFNTANVTDMRYMFENCKSLTDIDLSLFRLYDFSSLDNPFLRNKYPEYFI